MVTQLSKQSTAAKMGPPPGGRTLPSWLIAALLLLATAAVYLPTLQDRFIQFDDPGYITANAHVQAGLSWSNAAWAFRTMTQANWHPLAWLSHMLDCQLFGLNPVGHHASSILLHALNATLLFLLLHKATGLRWQSLMVASLFAFHPLNVETVAWVSERKSLLSMLFSLVTVGLYGWYARAPHWRRYLPVVAGFALALLSKPMAVTLPLVLLLLDYWPLRRICTSAPEQDSGTGRSAGRLILEKTPLLMMSLASSWVTLVAQKQGGAVMTTHALPIRVRLANAAVALLRYMGEMVWPRNLSYFYPLRISDLEPWKVTLATLILLAISALVYRFRRRRHLVFGWLLFLVTLLPVIGIVQVGSQSIADRYTYIPLIGLFVAIVWEAADAMAAIRLSWRWQACVAVSLIGLAANCTRLNESYWKSNLSLFLHAHQVVYPPDLQIETNVAAALSDAGRYSEALAYFRNAEAIAPNSFTAHYNCGYTLARLDNPAAAEEEFQQAIRLATTPEERARASNSLAIAELNLGKYQQAADAFSSLLAIRPDDTEAMSLRGQAFLFLHDYDAASRDLWQAAQASPSTTRYLMAGRALEKSGQTARAVQAYQFALKIDPSSNEARERMQSLRPSR